MTTNGGQSAARSRTGELGHLGPAGNPRRMGTPRQESDFISKACTIELQQCYSRATDSAEMTEDFGLDSTPRKRVLDLFSLKGQTALITGGSRGQP